MELNEIKKTVAETGKMLLEKKLVARTWGNVSARINKETYAITPSGLDYTHMTGEDIAVVTIADGTWQGLRKPSGERGIHTAAYDVFPDVNFVIHTHQNYASALGLAGFDKLQLTIEEKAKLGGMALSGYGLPSTGKLKGNVRNALESGAKVVLMAHHGALICGKNREEAFEKAVLLEEICGRNLKGVTNEPTGKVAGTEILLSKVKEVYPNAMAIQTPAVLAFAKKKEKLYAQLDDMAQMIGRVIPTSTELAEDVLSKLKKSDAVLVSPIGIIVKSEDKSDTEALGILVDKACICKLHTESFGEKAKLSWFDDTLMRFVYKKKYSKQK